MLRKTTHCLDQQSRSFNQFDPRVSRESDTGIVRESQNQAKYQDENVTSKKKKGTKPRRDSDEEPSESGLPSYHTTQSPSSSSESEGDIIEYDAISPSQPKTSGIRPSKILDLT